jgi:hypothetical protein
LRRYLVGKGILVSFQKTKADCGSIKKLR